MSCREVGGRTWPYVHRAKYASVKERRMAGVVGWGEIEELVRFGLSCDKLGSLDFYPEGDREP